MKKICITDSGFGGLSVCEELVNQLIKENKAAQIVYFNACYADNHGYNSIEKREDKIEMFDRALSGIESYCAPDEILVACKTLSVLLQDTTFVLASSTPVKSIVDSGVRMIQEVVPPEETITIFGTETTVNEGCYPRLLADQGWDETRVKQIPCPGLQYAISSQDRVEEKINEFKKSADKNSWFLMGCTHFGICSGVFNHCKILNPNLMMAKEACKSISSSGPLEMQMVSRYQLKRREIDSWINLLNDQSTIIMLKNYRIDPHLF